MLYRQVTPESLGGWGWSRFSGETPDLGPSSDQLGAAPLRGSDPSHPAVNEAIEVMKAGGGLDALHMAFYQSDDIGKDHEWDIWRLEGPTFVWHFRGAPHVHAYVNIAKKA